MAWTCATKYPAPKARIWLNHWLRTGFEMFTTGGQGGYVAEKAESDTGWLFPVGDEEEALGYEEMFMRYAQFLRERVPRRWRRFYDGYVVNAIMDAAYRSIASKRWEPVALDVWRGAEVVEDASLRQDYNAEYYLIKQERMPDDNTKLILKHKQTGEIVQVIQ